MVRYVQSLCTVHLETKPPVGGHDVRFCNNDQHDPDLMPDSHSSTLAMFRCHKCFALLLSQHKAVLGEEMMLLLSGTGGH